MTDSLGIYLSVPFCKAKCTYCNFASGVFGAEKMDRYIERVCLEIAGARTAADAIGVELPQRVDTIFFGGGTPSLFSAEQMRRLFDALHHEFEVTGDAEVTLECAPGQLSDHTLAEMLGQGMNRVSFGVQSFVDAEAKAVGRLHTREMCLAEIGRMRASGVTNVNVDLIAGLPGQTENTWRESVDAALQTGVPHVSVYMLEVDEDSRLGREMLGAGARYGADNVASEDEIADRYAAACQWLEADGVEQYEISNFARAGKASRHNLKYWQRDPYVGFGLDAHSMLREGAGAVRWANTSDLEDYLEESPAVGGSPRMLAGDQLIHLAQRLPSSPEIERIGPQAALEEALFLGLRLNRGVPLAQLRAQFGDESIRAMSEALSDAIDAGLATADDQTIKLTANGRMASNEVFSRLLTGAPA